MRTYSLSLAARADLARIYRRGLRDFGEAQADRYFSAFFRHFDRLATQPFAYPAVDDIRPGYRRSVCGVDSVYYRVNGPVVEIMAIIGEQDLDAML